MLGSPTSKYYSVHATPRGANDARPTALGIVHDENLEGKWADKTIMVTGGSAFVGLETARALHATGATVYITVRDTAKGQKAIDDIFKSDPTNKAPIHMITMTLDDLDEGYAPWAYDQEKEDRLWADSLKMVGIEEGS